MRWYLRSLIFYFAVSTLCGASPNPPALIEQYRADEEMLARHFQADPDSERALARRRKLLEQWLERVSAGDASARSSDDRIDLILLRNQVQKALLDLDDRAGRRAELAPWLPFRRAIENLADHWLDGDAPEPKAAAGALGPVSDIVVRMMESLKAARIRQKSDDGKTDASPKGEPPSTPASREQRVAAPTAYQALILAEETEALGSTLKKWFDNYSGFVPGFSWWVKAPYESAAKSLSEYARYAREEIAGVKPKHADKADGIDEETPLLGRAIGAGRIQERLATEFIPYSPRELITLAEAQLAWCEDRLKRASNEMGLGDDWKAAIERVKGLHADAGRQESFVRGEARRAIAYVKERNLVTIPPDCEELWGAQMLPANAQRNQPYAAYSGHDILIAYADETMKQEDKLMAMRGNNQPFTRNVVPHELIPGHHLQFYYAARERPYRREFSTPFFVEGWAVYWEMRLFGLGYQQTPEDRVGALFWRMHRCARIIVTLKFHLGEMSPDEMVRFLVERVGHERLGATSEVRRYIKGDYGPLYQCGYLLGALQFMALHREMVEQGSMTERQFHDGILQLGPIPVELIRASLQQRSLPLDYRTEWKFDGNPGP